jgi:glucose-1-phosphate cytidylyltransferase
MFEQESEVWINGGYFIFRHEIFDYIRDGEELVLEPFDRLIAGQLVAYK